MTNTSARLRLLASGALLATGLTLTLIPGPAFAGTSDVKLTCSNFTGAGFINWDISVQLNPDGTAASATELGDAYLTGVQLMSIERTDPANIAIGNAGRSMSFTGSALTQVGILGTSFTFSGPPSTCHADFTFPNPGNSVINLEPSS